MKEIIIARIIIATATKTVGIALPGLHNLCLAQVGYVPIYKLETSPIIIIFYTIHALMDQNEISICNACETLICKLVYLFIVFGEQGKYIDNINHLW